MTLSWTVFGMHRNLRALCSHQALCIQRTFSRLYCHMVHRLAAQQVQAKALYSTYRLDPINSVQLYLEYLSLQQVRGERTTQERCRNRRRSRKALIDGEASLGWKRLPIRLGSCDNNEVRDERPQSCTLSCIAAVLRSWPDDPSARPYSNSYASHRAKRDTRPALGLRPLRLPARSLFTTLLRLCCFSALHRVFALCPVTADPYRRRTACVDSAVDWTSLFQHRCSSMPTLPTRTACCVGGMH